MTKRERRLDEVIARHGIESDYNHTTTAKRYVSVMEAIIDGEQPSAMSFDSTDEALEWMAEGYNNDNPREPVGIWDLDEDRFLSVETQVRVVLV